MGLVESTGNHTAFDSSVVFHEFTHGVTNRLVGGRLNDRALEAPQSDGMGEGWSDYFPCTINNTTVVGPWVVGRAGGIRQYPYDSDFPDNFGDLGTGRYTGRTPDGDSWPHPIGEIWCATLLEMNRRIGAELGVQLVVDGLKGTPANPSFLDARDAILSALDEMRTAGQISTSDHVAASHGIWSAFAHFGMGLNASSNGAWLSDIVADFEVPDGGGGAMIVREVTPNQGIPDADPAGITSALNVVETGQITKLVVSVDITHSYKGDLVVSLVAPDGRRIVLHNRQGASGDNINTSYSSVEVDGMAQLVGAPVEGNWMLHVADFAGLDIGRLRYWKLEISRDVLQPVPIRKEASPALTIPDNDPAGVASVIEVTEDGSAKTITIGIDITHTYIGDLRVVLVAPSGQQAILHNQEGGDQDNLIKSYDSDNSAALSGLIDELVQGNWILRVTDIAGRDTGKLNRWTLEIGV
jgi:subtilisin-like proprotein convertase family protein